MSSITKCTFKNISEGILNNRMEMPEICFNVYNNRWEPTSESLGIPISITKTCIPKVYAFLELEFEIK